MFLMSGLFMACNKVDYPAGLAKYDNYYYIGFISWKNSTVSVQRSQTNLVKFPVEFYSSFIRGYDAVAHFKLDTAGITSPAIAGKDFDIVDEEGNVLEPVGDSVYTITFPKAQQAYDTIYIKLLDNPQSGTRKVNIDLVINITKQYTVGTFSQAYRRLLQIN
jgi:hypothetical protein